MVNDYILFNIKFNNLILPSNPIFIYLQQIIKVEVRILLKIKNTKVIRIFYNIYNNHNNIRKMD